MITQELFIRFLRNECSEQEKQQVAEYFSRHPEELDKFFPPEEFTEMTDMRVLGPELEARIYKKVRKNVFSIPVVRMNRRKVVAAAAVITLVFAGWWFFVADPGQGRSGQLADHEQESVPHPGDTWEQVNTSGGVMRVMLPDSSAVDLGPNSSIRYYGVFGGNGQRGVYLSGEARFHVAANAANPFTVYSGDIATTALGTSFTVSAFDDRNIISVHLHTGKVVVSASDPLAQKLENEMYLDPGEKLLYNKATWRASIHRPKADKAGVATTGNTGGNVAHRPDWYMFNGQQLADVLDQLSFYYGIDIEYKKEDIKDNYLTAKFSAVDSLDKILKDIALLNRLSVSERNGRYFVKKKAD